MEAVYYMSFAFEIGWVNAWLGFLPLLLTDLIAPIIDKNAARRFVSLAGYTTKDKISVAVSMVLFYGMAVYSIGVPLRIGTTNFWLGLAIFLVNRTYSPEEAAVSIPYEYLPMPEVGSTVDALDRRGERVCSGRVIRIANPRKNDNTAVVTITVPKRYSDQVRSLR